MTKSSNPQQPPTEPTQETGQQAERESAKPPSTPRLDGDPGSDLTTGITTSSDDRSESPNGTAQPSPTAGQTRDSAAEPETGPATAEQEGQSAKPDSAKPDSSEAGQPEASGPGLDDAPTVQVEPVSSPPPPWQRVPVSVSSTDRTPPEPAGRGRTAAAPVRPSARSGPVATDPTPSEPDWFPPESGDVPRETPDDFSSAQTVYLEPANGDMKFPLGGSDGTGQPPGQPKDWPRNRRPRQAALQLKRLDPWSVLKIALVLAVVLYLVWLVAVGVLYGVLDGIGVWDRLNGQYADLVAEQSGDQLISAGRVLGVAAVIGAVNSLLLAVAMSVGAFVYNVAADLVGGIEVTLSERD